jgi:SAM-dependent methyltransferase
MHSEKVHNVVAPNIILPLLFEIFKPNSILDIGCGIGTWLSVAKDLGVVDILGIDGEYVDRKLLSKYLRENEFLSKDLTKPFELERRFDLTLCLEVAEHLPESSANALVKTLVDSSDIILFSAAIPGQGGQNHLNEQWPHYWAEKFSNFGYMFLDVLRPLIWNNSNVDFWYKQNIFIVTRDASKFPSQYYNLLFNVIHPDLVSSKNAHIFSLKKRIRNLLDSDESFKFYFSLLKKKIIKVIKNLISF